MNVQELIDELKSYNPQAEVTTPYSETICLGYIDDEGRYDKKTTKLVFIEWSDYAEDND